MQTPLQEVQVGRYATHNKFSAAIKELGYPDGSEATGKRGRIWLGIRLNDEYKKVVNQGEQPTIIYLPKKAPISKSK